MSTRNHGSEVIIRAKDAAKGDINEGLRVITGRACFFSSPGIEYLYTKECLPKRGLFLTCRSPEIQHTHTDCVLKVINVCIFAVFF